MAATAALVTLLAFPAGAKDRAAPAFDWAGDTALRLTRAAEAGERPALRGALALRGANGAKPAGADGAVPDDVRTAIRRAPNLRAALERADAADQDRRAARGAMLPKLVLRGEMDLPAGRGWSEGWAHGRRGNAGVSLALPLFTSGASVQFPVAGRTVAGRTAAGGGAAENRAVPVRRPIV